MPNVQDNRTASAAQDNLVPPAPFFATSLAHVLAELERVDLFICKHVGQTRQMYRQEEQLHGLVISEQEIDDLLARPTGSPRFATGWNIPAEAQHHLMQLQAAIDARRLESSHRGITLRLDELKRVFGLTPLEIDCLLICLAPELDRRYERFYAYLQDDVTKKWPSIGFLLDLLCSSFTEKISRRALFLAGAPLIDFRLLSIFEEPGQPPASLISRYLRVDERIVNYLLETDQSDCHLVPGLRSIQPAKRLEEVILPAETKQRLLALAQCGREGRMVLYLQGVNGCGRKTMAEALCRSLGIGLQVADLETILSAPEASFQSTVHSIVRENLLLGDAVYWDGFQALLADDKKRQLKTLLTEISQCRSLTFLAGDTPWQPGNDLHGPEFVRAELPTPRFAERVDLWQAELQKQGTTGIDVQVLANKFRFSGGQIKDVARTAKNLARWRDCDAADPNAEEFHEACRLHSSQKLSSLGRKINPRHSWDDIVLPEDRVRQLREICDSMKYRSLVFDQWGFDRKLSLGKGLNVLFAGPSGTGKTMAAEIMAGELGLDLYKIDLSTIVSKYIGETEKNLARIFAEAEGSNAILFFDEADALFGKRSEVRDSHDRYANIEINYLLQKMEEHQGMVILATNFRKNMDDAFVRRLHFTVEFPFPGEADRQRIWQKIWPEETPQAPDLDFGFMARRFEMAGGNIRNVAMAAAFLAASNGGVVKMAHLLHGTRREYQKMGKVVTQDEFE